MDIKNDKGEQLYTFTIVDSNNFTSPHITLKTWDKAIQDLKNLSEERNNDDWFIKVIESEINPELHRARVELLCKHKGWGRHYVRVIKVDSAYTF